MVQEMGQVLRHSDSIKVDEIKLYKHNYQQFYNASYAFIYYITHLFPLSIASYQEEFLSQNQWIALSVSSSIQCSPLQ